MGCRNWATYQVSKNLIAMEIAKAIAAPFNPIEEIRTTSRPTLIKPEVMVENESKPVRLE